MGMVPSDANHYHTMTDHKCEHCGYIDYDAMLAELHRLITARFAAQKSCEDARNRNSELIVQRNQTRTERDAAIERVQTLRDRAETAEAAHVRMVKALGECQTERDGARRVRDALTEQVQQLCAERDELRVAHDTLNQEMLKVIRERDSARGTNEQFNDVTVMNWNPFAKSAARLTQERDSLQLQLDDSRALSKTGGEEAQRTIDRLTAECAEATAKHAALLNRYDSQLSVAAQLTLLLHDTKATCDRLTAQRDQFSHELSTYRDRHDMSCVRPSALYKLRNDLRVAQTERDEYQGRYHALLSKVETTAPTPDAQEPAQTVTLTFTHGFADTFENFMLKWMRQQLDKGGEGCTSSDSTPDR